MLGLLAGYVLPVYVVMSITQYPAKKGAKIWNDSDLTVSYKSPHPFDTKAGITHCLN
jgi:hypothetical protein